MWILKLELAHDCIIGSRCKKFQCTSTGYPLDSYQEKNTTYSLHFEKINGKQENIKAFLADLENDKNIIELEIQSNNVFFVYADTDIQTMPGQLSKAAKKVFHTRPVHVDTKGVEHWELAAWRRKDLTDFIKFLKETSKGLYHIKIKTLIQSKLNDIFFPQVMPNLTKKQKEAFNLAIDNNYYEFPRQIELKELADQMNLSLSTYREHLRKAEKTILNHRKT